MLTAKRTIKVLIIDDSAIVRKVLTETLGREDDIEVVGAAPDPIVAELKIKKYQPDVLTLDIEMPRMDGITFLGRLMQNSPMPVVVLSSLTPSGSKTALAAIEAGAVDIMCKPGSSYTIGDACTILVDKIRAASRARVERRLNGERRGQGDKRVLLLPETTNKIFAIGASTGGVQAISTVLGRMPANLPGTVIVQHMPANFTKSFAERLNTLCSMEVKEAVDGDHVLPGRVLIAPGGYHMLLRRSGANYCVSIEGGPMVCRQKPSVEVLFNSVAKYAGSNAVGAILTGMGDDGAKGLLSMKNAGARTIAQDEASSVVYGMPKEAVQVGAADKVVPLNDIARTMLQLLKS